MLTQYIMPCHTDMSGVKVSGESVDLVTRAAARVAAGQQQQLMPSLLSQQQQQQQLAGGRSRAAPAPPVPAALLGLGPPLIVQYASGANSTINANRQCWLMVVPSYWY